MIGEMRGERKEGRRVSVVRGVNMKTGSELRIESAISSPGNFDGAAAEAELELEVATDIRTVQQVIQKSFPTSPPFPLPERLRAHQALDLSAGVIPSVECDGPGAV